MNGGFVKLYRSIESWEWYTDTATKVVFLHCLIRANHKPKRWRGKVVEAGSFVTSSLKLAEELHLSRQVVRTSLERLKSTNEITITTTNKFTVISVVKWADFQSLESDDNQENNQLANQQLTNNQPTTNQQLTTNKKYKKLKNEKNKDNDEQPALTKSTFGEFGKVKLTPEEHAKIVADGLTDYIARVDAYKASTGKKYSSDYATIRNWAKKDGQSKRIEPIPDYYAEPIKQLSDEEIDELKRTFAKGKK